jgi:hypothetical protein
MEFIPGWTDFTLGPGLRLDVMTSVKGISEKDFDELYQFSETTVIQDVTVRVIDYKKLIKAKQASNRTKDQLDIEELEKIKSGVKKIIKTSNKNPLSKLYIHQ